MSYSIPNPPVFCPGCGKSHSNAVFEMFNKGLLAQFSKPPADVKSLLTTYLAGHHDALIVMGQIAQQPEDFAALSMKGYSLAVRDAMLKAMDGLPMHMIEQAREALNRSFHLEGVTNGGGCFGN